MGIPSFSQKEAKTEPGCAGERKFPSGESVPRSFRRLMIQDPSNGLPAHIAFRPFRYKGRQPVFAASMNPKIIFLTALRAKKFTPATPGHAEEISLKIIPGTPDPVFG